MPGSVDFRVFTDLVFLVFIYIDHAAATFQYNFMVNKRPIKAKCILHFLAKKVVNQGLKNGSQKRLTIFSQIAFVLFIERALFWAHAIT